MGIALGDYIHTGRPSIFVTNFTDENDLLYRNDGNWNFKEVSYPVRRCAAFVALGEVGNCVRRSRQRWLAGPDSLSAATSIRRSIHFPPALAIANPSCCT